MKAIVYSRFGPAPEVLEEIEIATPVPGPSEVLVRVAYSGVNPSDAKARAGARPGVTKPAYPQIIPHSDGSGVIEAVGDGVDPDRIGQRVWLWNGQWQRAFGTAAEYITLPIAQAVPLPENISLESGATLGIPGLTAAHTVFGDGDVAGKTLLISGGAGAVGHNAVQLAKWGGARVISTCSPSAATRVAAAGADHVLDYADPDLATKINDLTKGKGINRAVEVEFGQNAALLADIIAPNSTIATYGSGASMTPTLPFGPYLFKALKIDITLIYILPQAERQAAINCLHQALAAGVLTPAIHAIFPLQDCAKAHDTVMTPGRAGAVLLTTC
ncbi:Quinone oxidoreductase 1 [Roseovarius litorisediminis]|uniref:Quinone oxidoreductase 1 n=1 Tax=Roseovarius litorisediminis TaxID=1312363 RepID=A0A1Y5S4S0_9RHOB|nr:NADPH:quinone reductase [Roseovarius litorisediminis]SLN32568.1 Quinone oxidoreductase 1 [Roseovarius litorisediminis]